MQRGLRVITVRGAIEKSPILLSKNIGKWMIGCHHNYFVSWWQQKYFRRLYITIIKEALHWKKLRNFFLFVSFLCTNISTVLIDTSSNRNSTIEYHFPREMVYYTKLKFFLTPSLKINSNIVLFLNLIIETNHSWDTKF